MAPKSSMKLTGRDLALLQDVYTHRYLSIGQVQRLHFPSEQTTYRRLRALRAVGLVRTFSIPGIEESLVSLGKAGAVKVAEAAGKMLAELHWSDKTELPQDHYFARHTIAVNDIWINLRQVGVRGGVRLLGFIPDAQGSRTRSGGMTRYIRDAATVRSDGTGTIAHTPDAVFALARGDRAALFFLEVDRGTEVVSDPAKGVLKSIRFYIQYLVSGAYQRYARDFSVKEFKGFRALYLTTSETRVANIREAASTAEGPSKVRRFLWITTSGHLSHAGILGTVWQSLDRQDVGRYTLLGMEDRVTQTVHTTRSHTEGINHG